MLYLHSAAKALVALTLSTALLGCGRALPGQGGTVRQADVVEARASHTSSGNHVSLLVDAPQIFPAIEATIRSAQKSVQVHTFQLGGDTGMRIVAALAERKAAGVQVQVLTDPSHGAFGDSKAQFTRCLKAMAEAGIPHRDFKLKALPKGPTWLSRQGVIDHSKLVVADGKVAIMGGMNFYDHGAPNRDYMVRIEGPAATELGQRTNNDWRLSGGTEGEIALETAPGEGGVAVTLAETSPRERSIRPLLLRHFDAAQSKIWVQVLFLDDDRVVESLIRAHRRGVDVRVILDPIDFGNHVPELDHLPFDGIPNWAAVAKLLDAEVPVHWFVSDRPGRNLHAKISLVDDRHVLTGSANYTYRSFDRSRELAMAADSPELAAAFASVFLQDQAQARRITHLTKFQRLLASLFDRIKRGAYTEETLKAAQRR